MFSRTTVWICLQVDLVTTRSAVQRRRRVIQHVKHVCMMTRQKPTTIHTIHMHRDYKYPNWLCSVPSCCSHHVSDDLKHSLLAFHMTHCILYRVHLPRFPTELMHYGNMSPCSTVSNHVCSIAPPQTFYVCVFKHSLICNKGIIKVDSMEL